MMLIPRNDDLDHLFKTAALVNFPFYGFCNLSNAILNLEQV